MKLLSTLLSQTEFSTGESTVGRAVGWFLFSAIFLVLVLTVWHHDKYHAFFTGWWIFATMTSLDDLLSVLTNRMFEKE